MDQHQQRKRQRTSNSCISCRQSKIKCDGAPVCFQCFKRSRPCEYNISSDKRKQVSKDYAVALKSRIEELEAEVNQLRESKAHNHSPLTDLSTNSISTANTQNSTPSTEHNVNDRNPFESEPLESGKWNYGEDSKVRFYGKMSNLGSYDLPNLIDIKTTDISDLKSKALHVASLLKKDFQISKELSDDLIHNFLIWQNNSVPIVSSAKLRNDLDVQSSLFAAICAIGAKYSTHPSLTELDVSFKNGIKFANFAKFLIMFERESPSLESVQTCCLLSLHFLSIDQEAHSFDYISSAVSMAYTLGLDKELTNCCDQETIDERRMVWWALYLVESSFINLTGRPSSIDLNNIQILLPSLNSKLMDEYTKWNTNINTNNMEMVQDDKIQTTVDQDDYTRQYTNFRSKVELFKIFMPSLKNMDLESTNSLITTTIITKANVALYGFLSTLPSFLRLSNRRIEKPIFPHLYTLHITLHGLTISLNRPLIDLNDVEDTGDLTLRNPYNSACLKSAQSITKLIKDYNNKYGVDKLDLLIPDILLSATLIHLSFASQSSYSKLASLSIKYFKTSLILLKLSSKNNLWSRRCLKIAKEVGLKLLNVETENIFKFIELNEDIFFHYQRQSTGVLKDYDDFERLLNGSALSSIDDFLQFLEKF